MLELGTPAPEFTLPEPATDEQVSLSDFTGQPLLVIFSCNHCPFVLHILDSLVEVITAFQGKGISCVMINSNDVEGYPDDSPDKMIELASERAFSFPYLYDQSQQVAQDYRAACTPDLFLFDRNHRLYYRGQFDGARPGNDVAVTGADLSAAMSALLAGQTAPSQQLPSLGCNIKWRAGNEPEYF
jgi:peroxiredoxin